MKKRIIGGSIIAGVLLLGAIGSAQPQPSNVDTAQPAKTTPTKTVAEPPKPKPKPTCDGTAVTSSCTLDGTTYKTYVYHPAVAEKSHIEKVTTYEDKITSYCTLCNDGTYSPSCATGRGACSHHGGVAQWNAPRSSKVPVYTDKTVVDAPYQAEYYEKVVE